MTTPTHCTECGQAWSIGHVDECPGKRTSGRKRLDPGQETIMQTVRLTATQARTYRDMGGADWLRTELDQLRLELDQAGGVV